MTATNIFSKIGPLDSLKQEKLLLVQKYKDLKKDLKLETNIFEIFKGFERNEKDFNKFLYSKLVLKYDLEKLKTSQEKKNLGEQIQLEARLILKDILRYFELESSILKEEKEKISISGKEIPVSKVSKYYSNSVIKAIKSIKKGEKYPENLPKLEEDLDKDLLKILGLTEKDLEKSDPQIQEIAWKYDFFKKIQNSVKEGYVFTHKELKMIENVLKDLKSGKVVLFTGDTGSGKTELARFICKYFLKTDYVFVSGSRDKEESDFTLEKVITSKSPLTTDNNIVDEETENNKKEFLDSQAEKVFNDLIKTSYFKNLVLERAKESNKTDKEIQELQQELEKMELTKKSLITEYHLMGIYKATKLGIPCIIDEVNIIRPEVFMALNDLLTRKIGDKIQLPNALGNIEVKEGFCIILTGNDPEQNSKAKKYQSGRYNFDEATYNRLRVYPKNYLNQINQTHKENKLNEDDMEDYLNENELYGVILMMMFNQNSKLSSAGKYGFEVMKKNLDGENIGKQKFFQEILNFAKSISTVQKAFAGETIPLTGEYSNLNLQSAVKRKVFSMRNLKEVLDTYKEDTLPLDYHIYKEFIQHTTNQEEKYALLVIFHKFGGFFGDLVTDNQDASFKNVEKKMDELAKNKKKIKLEDIENKFIVTKQDLYDKYFGKFGIEDEFFEKEKIENFGNDENFDEEEEGILGKAVEITKEDLLEIIENLENTLEENKEKLFDEESSYVSATIARLKDEIQKGITSSDKFSSTKQYLIQLNSALDKEKDNLIVKIKK